MVLTASVTSAKTSKRPSSRVTWRIFRQVSSGLHRRTCAEAFVALFLHPEQGFESLGVDKGGLLQVDDEEADLAVRGALRCVCELLGGVGVEFAGDADDGDVIVIFAADVHVRCSCRSAAGGRRATECAASASSTAR